MKIVATNASHDPLDPSELAVGSDRRNRSLLSPSQSRTGRNRPRMPPNMRSTLGSGIQAESLGVTTFKPRKEHWEKATTVT